jgi:hypothetical protein
MRLRWLKAPDLRHEILLDISAMWAEIDRLEVEAPDT